MCEDQSQEKWLTSFETDVLALKSWKRNTKNFMTGKQGENYIKICFPRLEPMVTKNRFLDQGLHREGHVSFHNLHN